MSAIEETTQKRPRGSPTLLTPRNEAKRPYFDRSSRLTSRRRIFSSPAKILAAVPAQQRPQEDESQHHKRTVVDQWKDAEIKALVEYVVMHSCGSWPAHHQQSFWEAAAMHVKMKTSAERTGTMHAIIYNIHPIIIVYR